MRFHDDVVEAVLKRNPVDPPGALVRDELRSEVSKAVSAYQAGGMEEKQAEETVKPMVPQLTVACERRVRLSILLDALAKQQGIEPPEGAVAKRIAELAERSGKSVAAVRASLESRGELAHLHVVEVRKAALDFLLEQAAAS